MEKEYESDTPIIGEMGEAEIPEQVYRPDDDENEYVPDVVRQQRAREASVKEPPKLEYLLMHLLRERDLMARAGTALNRLNYFQSDPIMDLIFRKALAYFEIYGKTPTKKALSVEIRADYDEHGLDEQDIEFIEEKLTQYYSETELSTQHARDMLRIILDNQNLNNLRDTLDKISDLETGRGNIATAVTELMVDALDVPVQASPFDDLENNLEVGQRAPTHVQWLDNGLEDGLSVGEMLAFLAPSGGGKSTLGLQIWIAQALAKEYCAYFSIEQAMKGDFTLRSAVLAGACTRADIEVGWDKVDPRIRKAIDQNKPVLKEYGAFFDFVGKEIKTIDTLLEPLRVMKRQGKLPKYVIIDWWGLIIDKILGAHAKDATAARRATRRFIAEMSSGIKELGCRLIVLHQLSGEAASKGAKAIQSSHSAQEDRNFNNLFDFALTCSKKGKDGLVRVFWDKARRTENNLINLKLDGKACRFTNFTDPDQGAGAQEMAGFSTFDRGASEGNLHMGYS